MRDVLLRLTAAGWAEVRIKGSHRHFAHPGKPGIVTVAGKPGDDVPIGTLRAIFRQAGLEWEKR